MAKRNTRLFLLSFFITLLLAGFLFLFFIVDENSAQYQSGKTPAALEITQKGPLDWDVTLLGRHYLFDFEPLSQAQALRREYACLLTPRWLRTALQAWAFGEQELEGDSNMYNDS